MKPLALSLLVAAIAAGSPSLGTIKVIHSNYSGSAHKPIVRKASVNAARQGNPVTSLTILYTSSARGQVRSCNCSKFRFGGYGRELTMLKSIRSKTADLLLLEGGDITGENGFQSELKADVAARALKMLGYSAMTPGEEELGLRGTKYIARFKSTNVPIVCANLSDSASDKLVFKPYTIVKTRNGLRVCIIGLLDGSIGGPMLEKSMGCDVGDPVGALRPIIKNIRAKSDLVIVVYHGLARDAKKLAAVNGVDFILTTHCGESGVIFPSKGSNEVCAGVDKIGGVTVVDARTKTNWSLGRIDLSLTSGKKISSATHKLIYLDRSFIEAPEMVKIYDDYNEKVKDAVLNNSISFKTKAETVLIKRGMDIQSMRTRLHKSAYATSEKCKDCHSDVYENWSKTRHSHAMSTLVKVKQEYDPECVSCHATGASARNGFVNVKETPELANVQCEACHGPGLQHMKSPSKGYGKCGEETCRSCHTDERTPNFDFDEAWEQIKH